MYQNKIELSPQDILEKEFKIDTRGYRLKEVDQYLDIIINDYERFYTIINDLEKEKADLLGEIMNLKQEIRNMKMNAEIARKAFSADNIPDMQKENQLAQDYENLLASAQVPFEGKTYMLSQMTPFKNDPDDARRLAAWKAEGQWYKDHQPQMDEIYDQLVHLRDAMGRRMGYEGYTTLGYYRMDRNCYTKEDLAKFRDAVAKYVVPVAERVYKAQAERLGVSYPMNFADAALEFRSGNAKPAGSADDIIAAGTKFYDELSPETSEFFHAMKDMKLMNLLSKEGKAGGGYCTDLGDYHMPFIFANFNGTQGDVEVITHEAGHAFEAYLNRSRVPMRTMWPTMEACE